MNLPDDHLETLLRAAGRSVPEVPVGSDDLADRVRRTDGRRRHARKMSIATAITVSIITSIAVLLANDPRATPSGNRRLAENDVSGAMQEQEASPQEAVPQGTEPPVSTEEIARMRAEIASLRQEAERCRQMAQLLIQQEELRRWERFEAEQRAIDLAIDAKVQREVTAFLMVDFAERQKASAARSEYERVISLFPDTKAAASARESLERLEISL